MIMDGVKSNKTFVTKTQEFGYEYIIVRFLALVTTMVTKVDHGNHCSNPDGYDNVTSMVTMINLGYHRSN